MSDTVANDRVATRSEVLAHRVELAALARANGLRDARADRAGVVIVHSDAPGYGAVRRFATAASQLVGAWVNVITDDVPAATSSADLL
jgi:hypothetical protein